jgi:O-antigen/teichoic acid export membrane protein
LGTSTYKPVFDTLTKRLPAIRLYLSSTGLLMAGLALQSVGFFILARWLGSEQFGHLSLITAATNLGSSWCGLGTADTIRRRGSREPSLYPDLLGHAVILLTASGAVLTGVMTAAIALWTTVVSDPVQNLVVIALLVSSNMVLFIWITLTEAILLTHSQFTRANLLNFSLGLARTLTAVVACVVFGVDSLGAWAWWNFAAFVLVSLACVWLLSPYGAPRWRVLWDEIPLGATFGISGTIQALRQNVDLLALSAVAPPQLVGAYGVTRRVLGIALVTGASLDRLLFNKFAIAGESGPTATLALAKKWVLPAIGLTALTSAVIFVLAPVLPLLFGDGFRDVVWIIKVLCWTLVLTAIQFIAFDAINAADQHRIRVAVTTVVGIAGAALIAALSLPFGITGIFIAVYVAEISIAAALWATLKVLSDRQRRSTAQ